MKGLKDIHYSYTIKNSIMEFVIRYKFKEWYCEEMEIIYEILYELKNKYISFDFDIDKENFSLYLYFSFSIKDILNGEANLDFPIQILRDLYTEVEEREKVVEKFFKKLKEKINNFYFEK